MNLSNDEINRIVELQALKRQKELEKEYPQKNIDKGVETLADILVEEEVKRKPDASDVRDTLIIGFCQECPDHDEYDCYDHECFIWEIFGILMEAEI